MDGHGRWEHAGLEIEAPWRVIGTWGPVRPGQERKPWVGERVHEHEGEGRIAKQRCERSAQGDNAERANLRIQKGIKNQMWEERMTTSCVFDKEPLEIGLSGSLPLVNGAGE